MMRCSFCDRWWARQWERSDAWERSVSNESELWEAHSDRNRELIEQAFAVYDSDPAAALDLYVQAAEGGSAFALDAVAAHYDRGDVVAADPYKALDYYHRAIGAGSWMATIYYARLLAKLGHRDDCERVLEDGVALDFVPASFWLAYLRGREDGSRDAACQSRPLLEHVAGQGHPAARIILAQYKTLGRFGLRAIPKGLMLGFRQARAAADEDCKSDAPLVPRASA